MKELLKNKLNLILIVAVVVLLLGGFFVFQKFHASKNEVTGEEVELPFDPEGPYALLIPRGDGNALTLNLKRTASYDAISYELAYVSHDTGTSEDSGGQGIDRGVVGTVKTSEKKSEYNQEILFGTCSKNICKYDTGVENGTLTLHITKGAQKFRFSTQWHIQRLALSHGLITSGDGHLVYKLDLTNISDATGSAYTIVNDLSAAPKLPSGKKVLGKVYALNLPIAKVLPNGNVTLEIADKPSQNAKIFRYTDSKGDWEQLDTSLQGSTLTASASGQGIFAILDTSK